MVDDFDPYYRWLGIPPEEQPADHYRLLGVRRFETDPEVISNASDQRMAHLRTFASGKRGPESQRLLNEVSAATRTLLDPAKRHEYDAALRARVAAQYPQPAYAAAPMAPVAPLPAARPVPVAPPHEVAYSPASPVPQSPAAPLPFVADSGRSPISKRRRSRGGSLVVAAIAVATLLLALPAAYMAYRFGLDEDSPIAVHSGPNVGTNPTGTGSGDPSPGSNDPTAPTSEGSSSGANTSNQNPTNAGATPTPNATSDSRMAWYYPVGTDGKSRGSFKRMQGKAWRLNATDTVVDYQESERTDDYIQIADVKSPETIRLYADRLERKKDADSGWIVEQPGRWVQPMELAALLNAPVESPGSGDPSTPGPMGSGIPGDAKIEVARLVFSEEGTARVVSQRSLLDLDKPFTLEFWFRRTGSSASPLGLVRCGQLNLSLAAETRNDMPMLAFELRAGNFLRTFLPGEFDSDWHHVALTSNGEQARVLFDGKPAHQATLASLGVRELNPIEFGVAESGEGRHGFAGEMHSLHLADEERYQAPGFELPTPRETHLPFGVALELNKVAEAAPSADSTENMPGDAPLAGAGRWDVPTTAEQKTAQERLTAIYGERIKRAVKPEDRAKLARELLEIAATETDVPVTYAVIGEARRLALQSGDVGLVIDAVEDLAGRFDVDREAEMTDSLKDLASRTLAAPVRDLLVLEAMASAHAALSDERIKLADEAAVVAMSAANKGRDAEQKKATRQLREFVASVVNAWEAKEKGLKKLEDSPDDAAAHLAVGRYFAFYRGDLEKAAPHFQESGDAALAAAAEKQLAADDPQAKLAAIEAWHAVAAGLKGAEKLVVQRHVLEQAEQLTPELSGLPKAQAEKFVDELKPLLAEAEQNQVLPTRAARFEPGLIARMYAGRPLVPTPYIAVVESDQDLFRLNRPELLQGYGSRNAVRYALAGVVVTERETRVTLLLTSATAVLNGQTYQPEPGFRIQPTAFTATLPRGTHPISVMSTSSTPRFQLIDAENSQSLLFHSPRELQAELNKLVRLPNGATVKGQRVE
jgi:hypothetical protein